MVVASSFTTLQIAVDRLFLAGRDTDDVSASMNAAMVFWMGFILALNTVAYSVTFVAQYLGAGRPERAGAAAWQGVWLGNVCGVLILGAIPLAGPVADAIGHPEPIRSGEAVYLQYLCAAAWPLLITGAVSAFFSGLGKTYLVMILNGLGLAVNAGVGYLLILGKGGFEPMGIAGAGWAIVLASWATAMLGMILMVLPAEHRERYGALSGWRPDLSLMKRLMRYGLPSGVQFFIDTAGFTLFVLILGLIGRNASNATSLTFTINLVAFLPMMGVSQAVGVLVGQYQGAGRPDLAARATHAGVRVAVVYCFFTSALYLLVPRELVELFRPEVETLEWAEVSDAVVGLLVFVAGYCLADGILLVYASALRAAGDTLFVTMILLALSGPVMVMPAYLTYRNGWPISVAWGGAAAYIFGTMLLIALRFYSGRWRSMHVIEPAVVEAEAPQLS